MNDFIEASPMAYGENLKCRVYPAEHTGPPLMVKENKEDPSHIVIELYDYMKVAMREMAGKEEVPITRIALFASDARWLCVHLIHALAKTEKEDGVASRLEEAMLRIIDELRPDGE